MLEIVAAEEPVAGQIVAARYRLERIVGEGGMGVVWAATHLLTEKACALKFLKRSRAMDPKNHERLLHEARAACRVRHPNVAPVHDILELPSGVPFIVMDLLEGESLAARIRAKGALALREALRVVVAVAGAVEAAHALGIVHRDLKPDNVFLEQRAAGAEAVFVLDFGIAKRVGHPAEGTGERRRPSTDPSLTTTFTALGTPSYMAPEQLEGTAAIDEKADLWALGILLFECVTGALPPRSAAGFVDPVAIAEALAKPLRRAPALVDLTRRMLADSPSERPSAAEACALLAAAEADVAPPRRATRIFGRPRASLAWIGVGLAVGGVASSVLAFQGQSPRPTDVATPTAAAIAAPADPSPAPGPPTLHPAPSPDPPPAVRAPARRPLQKTTDPHASVTRGPDAGPNLVATATVAIDDGIPTRERR